MVRLNPIVNRLFAHRLRAIDRMRLHPIEVQAEQLERLVRQGARTETGRTWGLCPRLTAEQFAARVPVGDYERFVPLIERIRRGEQGILWPEAVRWLAKSSGTTAAKSKYIPVTDQGLRQTHMQGPRDIMAIFCHLYPESRVLAGRMLTLGGSQRIEREGDRLRSGDLSSILISHTPRWAEWRRVPCRRTALLPDFEEKVRLICREAVGRKVSSFTGVPSWNLVLLNKVLEYTGKSDLLEVWPTMELFVHGGMNFAPYREQYRRLFPSPQMKYMETYNASEGFFALADDPARDDMLLMLDYGIYYEFLPLADLDAPDRAVPLEGVRPGTNYAMIITTCNGLWRYLIGDTVQFTSTAPYRIRITGRTKHYINAFGEEVIIDNAEEALRAACTATGAEVAEFTAAPVYMEGRSKGAHEWVVEFVREPGDLEIFRTTLDRELQRVNSDYEAKRFKDTTLGPLRLTVVPPGTFFDWMCERGKSGGQNKVPRLCNDRRWVEQLTPRATKILV